MTNESFSNDGDGDSGNVGGDDGDDDGGDDKAKAMVSYKCIKPWFKSCKLTPEYQIHAFSFT